MSSITEIPAPTTQFSETAAVLAQPTSPATLFERFLSPANITQARRRVVGNGGAPGSDGMGVAELDNSFERIWPSLEDALRLGTYLPAPLRELRPSARTSGSACRRASSSAGSTTSAWNAC